MAQQIPFNLVHRPALGREDFLVSQSNAEAVAWIDRWPDWPGSSLVIYGSASSGKTHLLHVWKEKSGACFFDPFKDDPGKVVGKTFFIDDAEKIAGDKYAETNVFHLFNAVKEAGGHLLLAGQAPPSRWMIATPDLSSRLLALPAVELKLPDEALLSAVLVKQFSDRQIVVGHDVIAFLVARMERSFVEAGSLVQTLDALALSEKRKITLPFVREILAKKDNAKNNSSGKI